MSGLPKKTVNRGPIAGGRKVRHNLHSSKLSPTLFNFYIADMPRPTEPVRRICHADDITVWASGEKISELDQKVNTYLTEMSRF